MDLIRDVRRATLAALKADSGLTAIVSASEIYPSTVPAEHAWPFMRWDAPSSTPLTWGATVSFMLHAFAKPRYNGGGAMIETAEDHASRIVTAAYGVVHRNRVAIPGGAARLWSRRTQLIRDGADADAYHGIITVAARAFAE